MIEFLQTYGYWIIFGLLFLLMMRIHGSYGGMGCGMGSHDHARTRTEEEPDGQVEKPQSGQGQSSGCH